MHAGTQQNAFCPFFLKKSRKRRLLAPLAVVADVSVELRSLVTVTAFVEVVVTGVVVVVATVVVIIIVAVWLSSAIACLPGNGSTKNKFPVCGTGDLPNCLNVAKSFVFFTYLFFLIFKLPKSPIYL